MSAEDRLRDALRDEADGVVPAGGWDAVAARRRRLDRRAALTRVAVVLLVVAGAVGLAVGLVGDDGGEDAVVVTPGPEEAVEVDGIWPYVSALDADRYGDAASFDTTDPEAVAEGFLGLVGGPAVVGASEVELDGDAATVVVTAARAITVELAKLGAHWTVTGVQADGLVLDAPAGPVPAPVPAGGRASAFEGTVHLSVLERTATFDRPRELGEAVVTGEQGELRPFGGTVDLHTTPASDGRITIVAFTTSAEDGSIDRVAAVPAVLDDGIDHGPPGVVLPAGEPLADDEYVVVRTEDIPDDPDVQHVEVRSVDGELRRTLLAGYGTAEGGVLDLEVSADRRTVLLALATSACTSEVTALAADSAGGPPASLGPGEQVALTPDGSHLAVLVFDGCGAGPRIERRNVDGVGDPVSYPLDVAARELVWVDGSTLVWATDGGIHRVRMVDDEPVLVPGSERWSAPARGQAGELLVVERTGSGARLRAVDPFDGATLAEGIAFPGGAGVVRLWPATHRPEGLLWLAGDGTLRWASGTASEVVAEGIALASG